MSYQPLVYKEQGGSKQVVASGGEIEVQSGGTLDLQSGATITHAGTITESGAVTQSSKRTVSSGGEIEVQSGATLDCQTGSTITLAGTVTQAGTTTISGTTTLSGTKTISGITNIGGTPQITAGTTLTTSGTLSVASGITLGAASILTYTPGAKTPRTITTKTADWSVSASTDSNEVFLVTASGVTATLPATAAGLQYTFIVTHSTVTNGFKISPAAADSINGQTDNKDLINTGATSIIGDTCTVLGDGSVGWYTIEKGGIWAPEA